MQAKHNSQEDLGTGREISMELTCIASEHCHAGIRDGRRLAYEEQDMRARHTNIRFSARNAEQLCNLKAIIHVSDNRETTDSSVRAAMGCDARQLRARSLTPSRDNHLPI